MKNIITFFAILSFLKPIYSIEPEYFFIRQTRAVATVFSACQKGNFQKAREMSDKLFEMVDIDQWNTLFNINHQKMTLLMFATAVGEDKFVDYLLKKGVAIDAKNNQDETALFFAVTYNHLDIALMLLKAGAKKDIKNKKGETLLDRAQQKKNDLIFEIFKASSTKQKKEFENALIKINAIIFFLKQEKNSSI